MKKWLIASVLAGLASAAPTATPVNVPYFDSVTLRGGGSLVVRHGAQQSVTLVSGDLETSGFTVDEHGKLEIEACRRRCSNYRLQVEIVTPGLEGIAVDGGGTIQAEGDFPDRDALALAIDGGGEIDATAIRARYVAAGISGGGSILTHARERLMAGIQSGGAVRYRGNPTVTSGINGGGSVSRLDR